MKRLMMLSMLGLSVTLAACGGGESDSSGSTTSSSRSASAYEFNFASLPNCTIDESNKIIYANRPISTISSDAAKVNAGLDGFNSSRTVPTACKVKIAGVNNGLTFSLTCPFLQDGSIAVEAEKSGMDSVKQMLQTGKPYYVSCEK